MRNIVQTERTPKVSVEVMKSLDFTFELVPHGFLKCLSLCRSPHKCLICFGYPLNLLLQLGRGKEKKPLAKYFLFTFDHRNSSGATWIRLNEALYVLHLKVIEPRSVRMRDREVSAQLWCSLCFPTSESFSGSFGTGNWINIPERVLMGPRCLHIHLFCMTWQVKGTKEQDTFKKKKRHAIHCTCTICIKETKSHVQSRNAALLWLLYKHSKKDRGFHVGSCFGGESERGLSVWESTAVRFSLSAAGCPESPLHS